MDALIELVLDLVTSETGGLAYRLVLVFSIAGAFQLALAMGRRERTIARRLAAGTGALVALQILLFLAAGLSWKGVLDAGRILPFLERAISLLSLVGIIWLWVFPKPSRTLDLAAFLVGFLGLLFIVFSGLSWLGGSQANLGGSWNDLLLTAFSLVLLSMAMALLALRKPLAWEVGLGMFLLLFLGYAAHLFWMDRFPAYSAILRLAELAAYPMLLALPLRLAAAPDRQGSEAGGKLQRMLRVFNAGDAGAAWRAAAAYLAHSGQADGCLLAGPPQPDGIIPVRAAYLADRHQFLEFSTLPEDALPQLVEAFHSGASAQWTAEKQGQELNRLASWLDLGKAEGLLLLPLGGSVMDASLLLVRLTAGGWPAAQVQQLAQEGRSLARFLHHMDQMSMLTPNPTPAPPGASVSNQAPEFHQAPVDLAEALNQALVQIAPAIHRKHQALQMDIPSRLPLACVPETELVEILNALITHAEQVTPARGEIVLRVQTEEDPQGAPLLLLQVTHNEKESSEMDTAKSSDLAALRIQVEGLGGQVWESRPPGQAPAVCLLLPAWHDEAIPESVQEKGAG